MPLTRGGRAIQPTPAKPRPTPSVDTPERDPYRFGVDETRLERRVAYVVDAAMDCRASKRALSEAVAERDRLLALLQSRAHLSLDDDPYRPEAERAYRKAAGQADAACVDICHREAWADAWWARLTPQEREQHGCVAAWGTDAAADTLLGRSFRIWPEYPLPPSFVVSRNLLPLMEWNVALAWNAAGLFGTELILDKAEIARRRQEMQAAWGTPGRR